MSEYLDTSVSRVADGVTARATDVNTLRDAVGTGFDLLPSSANLKRGMVNYGTDAGAADAYVVTLPHTPAAWADGLEVAFKAVNANTGASTLAVVGLSGTKSLRSQSGAALVAGDIPANKIVTARYNSTSGYAEIQSVTAGNAANIATVAGIAANVTTVAGIAANVTTVAGIQANVTTVAGISANVTTVAGISTDVTAVKNIAANVTTVAGIAANVTTVAGVATSVTTVAGASTAVSTVATNIADVNTAATNIAAIIAAPTEATNAAASATLAQNWATQLSTPVAGGEYSAKYWAQTAASTVTGSLHYKGSHDASTAAYPAAPTLGDYWKISVAGTISAVSFAIGDSIIYNGSTWDKIDSTDAVTAVNGATGAVTIEAIIHAATDKATPVDADELPLVDSAASNGLKKLTWANLKATLKTYFDTLYQAAGSYLTASSTDTLTNKRVTARVGSTTSHATPTINTDNVDIYKLTAQAEAITSFTTNLSGTPTDGQVLIIQITGTAARAITWGTSFEASTVALPTTTVTTAMLSVGFIYNSVTSKWRCVASC